MQRILVIGSSGSGKSTFARALASRAGVPCVELDELFWGPNWQPKPTEEFRSLVSVTRSGDCWVVEGNYSDVRDVLWPHATAVVWLNYSFPVVLWRAVRRTIARDVTRQELWHGNRESFKRSFLSRESILVWVGTTYARRRRQFAALQASGLFPHLAWIELKRPEQARRLLRTPFPDRI